MNVFILAAYITAIFFGSAYGESRQFLRVTVFGRTLVRQWAHFCILAYFIPALTFRLEWFAATAVAPAIIHLQLLGFAFSTSAAITYFVYRRR